MKIPDYLLFCIILSFFSCTDSTPPKRENIATTGSFTLPYHIAIERDLNNIKSVALSNLGKQLEYIPLETSPVSLLRRINEIAISDSYIFISDFDKLLQFDREGNFIRQVGSNGRGPGEYIHVSGFCIDEAYERIYIIAWGAYKVLEFDYDGRFLRFFKLQIETGPLETNQFLKNGADSFVFVLPNFSASPQGSENILIIADTVGTPIAEIKNYNKGIPNSVRKAKVPMFYHKNTIRILEDGVDTLKTLERGGLKPYAIFNLGKIKMDPNTPFPNSKNWEQAEEEYRNLVKDKLQIWDVNENNQYIFLTMIFGLSDSTMRGIFNKRSSEVFFSEKDGFDNDLDGGLSFWPRIVYRDSILIQTVEAYKFITHIRNANSAQLRNTYGEKFTRLERMANTLDEMSNPILIILKPG